MIIYNSHNTKHQRNRLALLNSKEFSSILDAQYIGDGNEVDKAHDADECVGFPFFIALDVGGAVAYCFR